MEGPNNSLCSTSASVSIGNPKKVVYFYDGSIGDNFYGPGHVMKPNRIKMTTSLVFSYEHLYPSLEIVEPYCLEPSELKTFHSADYVDFLSSINPNLVPRFDQKILDEYNISADCPVFYNMFDFSSKCVGGTLGAAVRLCKNTADIAINWAGGLHHAKKSEASGFCYLNDIVIGIIELLKAYKRVLYVDIDYHHGDGVEEAFLLTNRVMTVSFHRHGTIKTNKGAIEHIFPGTGRLDDVGEGTGENYSLNIPLEDGIDDESYRSLFEPIMSEVFRRYQPEAIVLQSGADSLSGDELGTFNLTIKGHGNCLQFLKSLNVTLMVLGGGGYTPRNVARCWCYETSLAAGVHLDNRLPPDGFYHCYAPDYTLHFEPSSMKSRMTRSQLDKLRTEALKQVQKLPHAPNVQLMVPPPLIDDPEPEEEDMDKIPDLSHNLTRSSTHVLTASATEPTYCFCNQVSYGSMIACDDPECAREWFHYGCVGIEEPLLGHWYCEACLDKNLGGKMIELNRALGLQVPYVAKMMKCCNFS